MLVYVIYTNGKEIHMLSGYLLNEWGNGMDIFFQRKEQIQYLVLEESRCMCAAKREKFMLLKVQ